MANYTNASVSVYTQNRGINVKFHHSERTKFFNRCLEALAANGEPVALEFEGVPYTVTIEKQGETE